MLFKYGGKETQCKLPYMELRHVDIDSRQNEIAGTATLPTVRLMGLFLDEQNEVNELDDHIS
jgi:hypothetical protein